MKRSRQADPGGNAATVTRPFQTFFEQEAAGGIVLLACAALALVWANTPAAESYFALWKKTLTIAVDGGGLSKSLHHWINDGLMAVFFFVVGLEIKRELLIGELSSLKKAALPVGGAIGGMVFPALFYAAFNWGTPAISGWGVPMATDIAFALGVLALLGPRVPAALKIFLAALAIADDLGAVLVIAVFYTTGLSVPALFAAAGAFALMIAANRAGVRSPVVYGFLGAILWVAVLKSGVHATIAGVLAAVAIPATRRIDERAFAAKSRAMLASFESGIGKGKGHLDEDQRDAVQSLEAACEAVESPLARFERRLHPWVAFGIMPLFALANAGVAFGAGLGEALADPVAVGTAVGLVVGKQLGVLGCSWAAVRLGVASLPTGVTWRHMYGVSCLCGIGFTMSLFIADLAFGDPATLDVAKTAVLAASVVSGLCGSIILARGGRAGAGEGSRLT